MSGTVDVFGLPIRATRLSDAVEQLLSLAAEGHSGPTTVHFCNVHSLVSAREDPALHEAFEDPAVLFPDGMPIAWLARRAGAEAERIAGPDLMEALMDRGRAIGARHFLYGGEPGIPERVADTLRARFPGLIVCGTVSPPFRALTPEEDARSVESINAARPDFVWVGLGSPKQDLWLYQHRASLNAAALLAVGAAFNFHAGTLRRAPRWMQRLGLEWAFRLSREPRRLWRRYLVTNLKFAALLASSARHPSSGV